MSEKPLYALIIRDGEQERIRIRRDADGSAPPVIHVLPKEELRIMSPMKADELLRPPTIHRYEIGPDADYEEETWRYLYRGNA